VKIRKWYLDCVADDGTTWIGYRGWVEFASLRFHFASSMLNAETVSVPRRVPEPETHANIVRWDAPELGIHLEMTSRLPSSRHHLHAAVTWNCVAPAADVTLRLPDRTLRGRGYAEVLDMSIAPWDLPIRELRWGRAIGERTSLVWIQWSGSQPLRLVLRDGVLQPAEDQRLTVSESVVLRDNRLGEALAPLRLVWLLPRRFTRAREQKWRGRGTLQSSDGSIDHGWVIHELVTFPAA
jgi:hypothetical protein